MAKLTMGIGNFHLRRRRIRKRRKIVLNQFLTFKSLDVTVRTACFNISNSTLCPHSAVINLVLISEQMAVMPYNFHSRVGKCLLRGAKWVFNLLKSTGYVMHQQFNVLKSTGYVMHQQVNLLKSTGYVMHQQFNLLKPTGHEMHQRFNIQQLYFLPTLYLCVLYLSENSDLCHLQHKLIGFYNGEEKYLLRGTDWVFK